MRSSEQRKREGISLSIFLLQTSYNYRSVQRWAESRRRRLRYTSYCVTVLIGGGACKERLSIDIPKEYD